MIKDYKFKDIEKYLKKDSAIGEDILEAFESLTDAAIIFTPMVFGVEFLPVLELLDVKDRLFKLGHKVYDYISQKIELDYIDRTEQIRAAYALICYTAYFDVFQNVLPKSVREKLKEGFFDKGKLIKDTKKNKNILDEVSNLSEIHCNVYYADHVTSFHEIKSELLKTYKQVTETLIKIVSNASVFNLENKKEVQEFHNLKTKLESLPQKALDVYEGQYIKLADQFNDFALFAQLQNFDGLHRAVEENKNAIDLVTDFTKKIDVGLSKLNSIVNSISTNYSAIQAQDIVDDLKRKYNALIEEPIIDDKEINSDTKSTKLRFPKIVDAFIPQSYKCLSYKNNEQKVEEQLKQIPVQYDIDKFFIKYLFSPDSIEHPLIILGHPGSGKSLLTKVLSAQLMSKSYTVIRIPLREVNAEDGIDVLVEDQIKKITNRSLSAQGYGGFASQFSEKPLMIILDGYDELLQAKGDLFSGYLEKVRTFQQDQKSLNRPVRIIITSRVTLIDKARIPENSTILRLMEFDKYQRQAWINIWNSTNANYFADSNIKPFSLPLEERKKKNSIIELAEQPLLLLMLALYDSDANELAKTNTIKRTELYDNLLRRFIRRERSRYVLNFSDKSLKEQEIIIDQEMSRLGVIAIGMYNRNDVVILSEQLEKDLDAFKAHRNDGSPAMHSLKEAESVLGGFFFIHKSTAQDSDAHSDNEENAYEFLHNTFGEFLAADFILRNTIKQIKSTYVDRKYKYNDSSEESLSNTTYNPNWYYCLMFVALYSRPVIVEMLREHAIKAFKNSLNIDEPKIEITEDEFIDNLRFIIQNQLNMVLNARDMPKIMRNGVLFDNDIPLLGYLSIYSLNLIILACAICKEGFEFHEDDYCKSNSTEPELNPWNKLIALWKAWFAPADLVGLSAILKAERKDDTALLIQCNEKFDDANCEQPIDIMLSVSSTLADNLLVGLSGLQTQRFREITHADDEYIISMLEKESPDLYLSYLIVVLRREINSSFSKSIEPYAIEENYQKINYLIETIIKDENILKVNEDTILNFFDLLESCIRRKLVFLSNYNKLIESLFAIVENNKFVQKKKFERPEFISASRCLQLLIRNSNFPQIDRRYNELVYRNILAYDERRYDKRIVNNAFHYTLRGIEVGYETEIGNNIQVLLQNIIQEVSLKGYDDRILDVEKLLNSNRFNIILETNPELLSQALLILLKSKTERRTKVLNFVNEFLDNSLRKLYSLGISSIGFNTIINIITVAKYSNEKTYLKEIKSLLRKFLLGNHFETILSIIFYNPTFIVRLIEVMPDLLDKDFLDIFEIFPIEKRIRFLRDEKIIDFVRICKHFCLQVDKELSSKDMLPEGLRNFVNMILKTDVFSQVAYKQLTITQLDDLVWLAEICGQKNVIEKIKDIVSHNQIKKNAFLDMLLNRYNK